MLINTTSSSWYLELTAGGTLLGASHISAEKTLVLPERWEVCKIHFNQSTWHSIERLKVRGNTTHSMNDGHILLYVNASRDVFTLCENRRRVLLVSNRTKLNWTFWDGDAISPECTIVPARSFLAVVGKTTVRGAFGAEENFLT